METLIGNVIDLMPLINGKIIGVVTEGFKYGLRILTEDGQYVEMWINGFKIDNG